MRSRRARFVVAGISGAFMLYFVLRRDGGSTVKMNRPMRGERDWKGVSASDSMAPIPNYSSMRDGRGVESWAVRREVKFGSCKVLGQLLLQCATLRQRKFAITLPCPSASISIDAFMSSSLISHHRNLSRNNSLHQIRKKSDLQKKHRHKKASK